MALHLVSFIVALLLAILPSIIYNYFQNGNTIGVLHRSNFPKDFIFGSASSSYQYEGAVSKDGKGPSTWDTFTHIIPSKIADNSTGDIAVDFYHRYKEDVKLMKHIGLDAFRFSISWPRILPTGKLSGGINKKGVAFYNNLIGELLANGIQPFVTLFHWDLPQALHDEYGGFLDHQIVDDFKDYADVCFKEFGDRVKYWMTINEPWIYISFGYDLGIGAPGHCSPWMPNGNCPAGDSSTEPYIVAHNILLSHATATKLYKQKYQAKQKGKIGIALAAAWMVPRSNSKADKLATQRALDFTCGWYMKPLTSGDYPVSMREIVGDRLPKFTHHEAKLVKGSFDIIGINYYFSFNVSDAPPADPTELSYGTDNRADLIEVQDEEWSDLFVTNVSMYPNGLEYLLVHIKKTYGNPIIYITENGMPDMYVEEVEKGIDDYMRIYFYKRHLEFLHRAINAGVKVKGFLQWSFLDNFEWNEGYNRRYGVAYVDYKYEPKLKRHLKRSALWYKKFLDN